MGALDGKVAIVTGGGRGLGRCHAEYLAAQGAAVVVNDLGDGPHETADAITAAGGRAVAHGGSVTNWDTAEALVRRAVDEFGDLHVVVNNAGFIRDGMSFAMEQDQFEAVVKVHLEGHFAMSRYAGAYWREQSKAGATVGRRIVNTTSESGIFGGPGQANYASAKGAIISLTIVLARELERYGVTVNCIAPRARTTMTESNPKFAAPETGFDRYDPANISPFVGWLASDDSAGVSGQTFIVIGGEVYRIEPLHIAASIEAGDQRWTHEALAAAMPGLLAAAGGGGVPPFAAPPMLR